MHVRKVKINPSMTKKHILTMQKGIPAKYPLRSGIVTSFTIVASSLSFSKENLVTEQLPRRVFLGLVSNASFNSRGGANPFNFHHYDLNYLMLSSCNQQFPSKPLTPNYGEENTYVESFKPVVPSRKSAQLQPRSGHQLRQLHSQVHPLWVRSNY